MEIKIQINDELKKDLDILIQEFEQQTGQKVNYEEFTKTCLCFHIGMRIAVQNEIINQKRNNLENLFQM